MHERVLVSNTDPKVILPFLRSLLRRVCGSEGSRSVTGVFQHRLGLEHQQSAYGQEHGGEGGAVLVRLSLQGLLVGLLRG